MVSEFCEKGTFFPVVPADKFAYRSVSTTGNLQSVLKSAQNIGMSLGLHYLIGAIKGIQTLHEWKPPLFHKDIKTLNLLVTSDDVCKLTDFGTSAFAKPGAAKDDAPVGTLPYCAPEILSRGVYTDKADMYSFGIVIWEVVSRVVSDKYQQPYAGVKFNSDADFIVQICQNGLRPTFAQQTPEAIQALCKQCWAPATDRPSAADVLTALTQIKDSL